MADMHSPLLFRVDGRHMNARGKAQSSFLTAIDLFSGSGGLTLGLKRAGFRVLRAVEIDPVAVRTYLTNHREVGVSNVDIRSVNATALRKELGLRPGELDLLAGCPPCQGFSTLRTRNGANRNRDSRNALMFEMLRFVRAFRPKSVMMENVPKLMKHASFAKFCGALQRLGYFVKFDIKDAALYGVPQRRKRLILLAGRGFDVPFAKRARVAPTVRTSIEWLPRPGGGHDGLHDIPEKRSPKVAKLIRDIPRDGGSRSDLPADRQLDCHRRTDGFKDIYGRMAWDAVAPTITGGCINPSKGRFLHPAQHRAITLREAAILQGFPRNYVFDLSAGKEAIALMIGNALPPEFIRRHALEIRRTIEQA